MSVINTHPRRRLSLLIVTSALLIAAIYLFMKRGVIEEYWLYFTEKRQAMTLDFSELSGDWSEDDLYRRFNEYPIYCRTYIGGLDVDRACGIYVKSYNSVPALFVSFFFVKGKLFLVSVNVPRWSYRKAYKNLTARFGVPDARQFFMHNGVKLAGWQLKSGAGLFVNVEPPRDLLSWGAILWMSEQACNSECLRQGDSFSLIDRLMSL
jgi:hypothetical protein